MFCPECGANCAEGERFCSSCGAVLPVATAGNNPVTEQAPVQPMQQTYQQPAEPVQPMQQTYQQPVQPVQPMQQTYQQPVEPVQPMQQTFPQQPMQQPQIVPTKKKSKKGLVIGVASVVVVAGGVVGGYFVYQNFAAKQFIENNPTKAVYNSYETYLSKRNESTAGFAGIVTKALTEKGTFALEVKGGVEYSGQKQDINGVLLASYDKSTNEYYFKADGLNSLLGYVMMGNTGSGSVKFYTNIDKINTEYDIAGQNGSYMIDLANLRSDAENSIFSPSKDNVLNMSAEDFEQTISSFEKIYSNFKDGNKKQQESVDKLIKLLEENGKTEVKEETITVRGVSRNVYTVSYTFDIAALKNLLNGFKDEMLNYVDNSDVKIDNLPDLKKSINETFDKAVAALDGNDVNKALSVVIKNSMDKDTKEVAKLSVNVENYSNENRAPVVLAVEFGNQEEVDISIEFSVNDDKGGVMTASAHSKREGDKTEYALEYNLKNNSDENKGSDQSAKASLVYDNAAKTFKLSFAQNGKEENVVEGKADISGNKAEFSYEQKVQVPDYSKIDYSSGDFSTDNLPQIDIGSINYTLKIASEPQIEKFEGKTNIFKMTKEEFEAFKKQTESVNPGYDIPDYDQDDDDNDLDGEVQKSNAAVLDSSCKTVYSGVLAGTITKKDIPSAPDKSASAAAKKAAAEKITIDEVLKYVGLSNMDVSSLAYIENGTIIWWNDPNYYDSDISFINSDTTLGDIYNGSN